MRFVEAGRYGANVEVKLIDPSANVYTASAAILAAALSGITAHRVLPAETLADPSKWTQEQLLRAGVALLPADVAAIVDALDTSDVARGLLGDQIVDATVATRRHEQLEYKHLDTAELADRFRLAWSI